MNLFIFFMLILVMGARDPSLTHLARTLLARLASG